MDNSMDALSALLSDPAALSKAMEMAKGLLGGVGSVSTESTPPKPPAPVLEDDKTRLLLALKPFLSPKRSEKVGTVIGLMRAMQVMGTILPHEEGE